MANTKRKDKSRKVLRKGESQRPDGTYQFRWTDENRKRHCIYARNLDDLRYKEDEIDKDKKDGTGTFNVNIADLLGNEKFTGSVAWVTKPASWARGKAQGNREWEIAVGEGQFK